RGSVDFAAEIELHRDRAGALRIGGAHLLHAGDGGEFALERRGDGGGHGRRIGTGEERGDLNGGVVDAGEAGYGEGAVSGAAEDQDGEHDEGRHDRPFDEDARKMHSDLLRFGIYWAPAGGPPPGCVAPSGFGAATATCAPGKSIICPSVTTVSPGLTPLSIMT